MGYGYIDNEAAYQAAIERRIRNACREKFNTKFCPAHPEVDWEMARCSRNPFVRDMIIAGEKYGKLSDKQVAAILASFHRDAEWAAGRDAKKIAEQEAFIASGVVVTAGRQVVRGTVVSMREESTQWGVSTKMLFLVNTGWKLWCSVPSNLMDTEIGVNAGDELEFSIDVTPNTKDVMFGFGKRPTKARMIQEGDLSCEVLDAMGAPSEDERMEV